MGKMDEKAKKRVAIARDVLKQLAAKKIKPSHEGYYVRVDDEIAAKLKPSESFGEAVAGAKCEVCALGAMFIGHVNKFNGVTVRDSGIGPWTTSWGVERVDTSATRDETCDPLRAYFSNEQLFAIEGEYESPRASKFKRYRTASGRLRAIMQNIIDNRGTFTP